MDSAGKCIILSKYIQTHLQRTLAFIKIILFSDQFRKVSFEERVAYLVAATAVAESHGEIPFPVRGVAHLLAVRDGYGGRYAPFLQVME